MADHPTPPQQPGFVPWQRQTLRKRAPGAGNVEFVCQMAVLISLVALSIDAVLPALEQIGAALAVVHPNDQQLVISVFFLGMAMGQMLYGPLSDACGRKKALYLGIALFIFGCAISALAMHFSTMLMGRFCQGFGVCSGRVVSMAMIRDQLEGQEMARVMSLIMGLFIIVPAIAPSLGQTILFWANWRAIFLLVLLVAGMGVVWISFRQQETLPPDKRTPFSYTAIAAGIRETAQHPVTRSYTLAAGIIFGGFIGYLNSAQQLLQIQYQLGDAFSLYFGALALALGLSSFLTAKLVRHYRIETLSLLALLLLTISSLTFFLYAHTFSKVPPLANFLLYLTVAFFCFGVLFGGFNTLALQPLGHIAGVATSVISSVQTLLSVAIGSAIGFLYNGTVLPLTGGFFCCAAASLAIVMYEYQRVIR